MKNKLYKLYTKFHLHQIMWHIWNKQSIINLINYNFFSSISESNTLSNLQAFVIIINDMINNNNNMERENLFLSDFDFFYNGLFLI